MNKKEIKFLKVDSYLFVFFDNANVIEHRKKILKKLKLYKSVINLKKDCEIRILENFTSDIYVGILFDDFLNQMSMEDLLIFLTSFKNYTSGKLHFKLSLKNVTNIEKSQGLNIVQKDLKNNRVLFSLEFPIVEKKDIKLIHCLTFFLRKEQLEFDLKRAYKCLKSLEQSTSNRVIIFNNGFWSNSELHDYLAQFDLDVTLIGSGENTGTIISRQAGFKYIWNHFPDTDYISELHLDMVVNNDWELPLTHYLENNPDEPMVSCGIIDGTGAMPFTARKYIHEKEVLPVESNEFLNNLRENKIVNGFTMPCIHRNVALKAVGGYDTNFLTGKQCFEDDSLLLGYHLYVGTKYNWKPKINFNSVVYHEVAGQRRTEIGGNDVSFENYPKLIEQYGAMGLKFLSALHIHPWQKGFFERKFNEFRGEEPDWQKFEEQNSVPKTYYIDTKPLNNELTTIFKNMGLNAITKNDIPRLKNDLIFFPYLDFNDLDYEGGWSKDIFMQAKHNNLKTVGIIYHLDHLIYKLDQKVEFEFLNKFDYIIVQTEKMKNYFIENEIKAKVFILEIWSYLFNDDRLIDPLNSNGKRNRIVYGGRIGDIWHHIFFKDFPHEFSVDFHGELYGKKSEDLISNSIYHGSHGLFCNYSEIPPKLRGDFGLIFKDKELDPNPRVDEYWFMSTSVKLSQYLAAKLPIIARKNTADSEIVEKYGIGFSIDSLTEIDEIINNLTEEQYQEYCINVNKLRKKTTHGYFEKRVAQEIIDDFNNE